MIGVMNSDCNLTVTATPYIRLKNRGDFHTNIWRIETDIAAALAHSIV
jgi:hypothetical protein